VYFARFSLSGLQIDSDVTMRGIKVGSVQSVSISPHNIEDVKVTLKLDGSTPIKTDSRAVVQRNFLTGLAWVDITQSTQNAPRLTEVKDGEIYPIIPEGKTELQTISDSIPGVVDAVGDIVSKADLIFADENIKAIAGTLQNFESISRLIKDKDQSIRAIIDNTLVISEDMKELSKSANKVMSEVSTDISSVSDDLREAFTSLQAAMAKFDEGIAAITNSIVRTTDIIGIEATAISQNVEKVSEALSVTAEGFERPQRIIFGTPKAERGPGEAFFEPQEK
jgi:phospholipid/cholesterol/gamma-HCH transport system substrate-binding protein